MVDVHYPEIQFRTKKEEGKTFIFDPLRKRWLLLTPEEWVRQHFVQWLVQIQGYPPSLIAMEKMLIVGEMKKRFDILVYDRHHSPMLMVECKASSMTLTDEVLHQLLRYHISMPAGILVVTNGAATYAWKKENGKLVELTELPAWAQAQL